MYDYYYHISSEHYLDDIKVPTLAISCREDPVCRQENIPIEKLYKNPNIITLVSQRGGHVEYISGWQEEWWAYRTALEYFSTFEMRKKISAK